MVKFGIYDGVHAYIGHKKYKNLFNSVLICKRLKLHVQLTDFVNNTPVLHMYPFGSCHIRNYFDASG